nr:hypothetical protein BaRGS_016580 [Batillaria attramentaria]
MFGTDLSSPTVTKPGNHGEDVKELYYYLDNIPTHSYMKALYKYPQEEYPYQKLVDENAKRSVYDNEYELVDTGVFDNDAYWDILAEYGKASPNDILAAYTVTNRGPYAAKLHILPTLWLRNVWSWGDECDAYLDPKPHLKQVGPGKVLISHSVLGDMMFEVDVGPEGDKPTMIFTENNTNHKLLYKGANATPYVKDAFHTYVVHGKQNAVNPNREGTKCAAHYVLNVESEQEVTIRVRLYHHLEKPSMPFGKAFDEVMAARHEEADCFYQEIIGYKSMAEQLVARQAYAGLLWSKQFYHYVVAGVAGRGQEPTAPTVGASYASWDLAFHMIPFANIDLHFAKEQLQLFLREWWVNRKDPEGKNIFDGGFLGLDNIGVFDRSKPLPIGGKLAQADATAWMAFFCVIMLEISLILARRDPIYEDMASKFFEHFVFILDAINNVAGEGLWNDIDGFYYDHVRGNNCSMPLKIRSMVGMVPLFSSMVLHESEMRRHPGFYKRTKWFLEHNKNLAQRIMCRESEENGNDEDTLMLTVVTRDQLVRVLHYLLDEKEFLSPYGIRSLSKAHKDNPFKFEVGHQTYCVEYQPSESRSKLFGGNSNWRGPIWFPMNYLLIENLHRLDYFYRDTLKVECPTGSGKYMRLKDVAAELSARLSRIFLPDPFGSRACHGTDERYAKDPNFRDLVLFYEYFDGETGRGCGASHQTGWTALIVNLLKSAHHRKSLSGDSTSSLCASTNY